MMTTFLLTPFIRYIGIKFDVIDRKLDRKVHRKVITKLGGIAIFLAIAFSTLSAILLEYMTFKSELGNFAAIFIGATIILLLGIYDDVRGAQPAVKIATQVLAACVLIQYHLVIEVIRFPGFNWVLGVWSVSGNDFLCGSHYQCD